MTLERLILYLPESQVFILLSNKKIGEVQMSYILRQLGGELSVDFHLYYSLRNITSK